jgi:hypothetical protein
MLTTRVIEVLKIHELESQSDCIRITYKYDQPGMFGLEKTDWIYTRALGNWCHLMFKESDNVSLEDFLWTMCERNAETLRKICMILHSKIDVGLYKFMYLIQILDCTFQPPVLNRKSRWQRELGEDIMGSHFKHIIATCRNTANLERLVTELIHITKKKYNN